MDLGMTGNELADEKMDALKEAIPFKDHDDIRKEFVERVSGKNKKDVFKSLK